MKKGTSAPTVWIWSDTHFGHTNIIKYCNRPFKNVDEMDEVLISNHNKLVSKNDTVIYVGDVAFNKSQSDLKALLDRLNGTKILVRGNHDAKARNMINAGFTVCVESLTLKLANETVLVSHFPYRGSEIRYRYLKFINKIKRRLGIRISERPEKYHYRRPIDNGGFLLHGHTHSKEKVHNRSIHVGVDAWDNKPINLNTISQIIANIKNNR